MAPLPWYDSYWNLRVGCGFNELTVTYFSSELLLAVMCLRITLLIRTFFNYSMYTDAFSKKLCKSYGFSAGARFTLKCQLAVNPEMTVITIFGGTVLFSAYIVRIFELPYFRTI